MEEKIKILSTVSIYHAINDGSLTMISILFPVFKNVFSLNYTQIGIITGASLLVSLIFQLILGRMSDGYNCRSLLSLGLLLISFSLFLLTFSIGFLSLLIFILLLRFSSSFFHPIGVGWISRVFKKDRLDWAMGMHSGFADIGAFIALISSLFIVELTNWQLLLCLWSGSAAIIILAGYYLTKDVDKSYLQVGKINTKKCKNDSILQIWALLKKIKILVPAFFISGASWGTIVTYLPLLIVERTDIALSYIGIIVSIWIGIGALISFIYGKMASLIGRKKLLLISYFLIGSICILLGFVTNIYIIILFMVPLGLGVFTTYPALASYISEISDEKSEGSNFGLIFTLQLGGGTTLLFIGGYLSDVFGIGIPFILLGLLSIILTIFLLLFYGKSFIISE